ncbi:hypothetical protein [Actinocorallia populi]|uniref:hypothetical protein n=1 Tax=Actinocorallia populi TaxID=2079200 RepID=UPI000D093A5A|nr:hypothetical protein [Actinocorallia populi]
MRLHKLSFEEEIRARQRARGPLKEGKTFEHGPAKFVFIALLAIVVVTHLIALVALGFTPS